MTSSSGVESDTETDKTFSDTEQIQENQIDSSRPKDTSPTSESPKEEYEVECIEGTHIFGSQPCKRLYKVRFKGWPDPEWQPEDNLDNSLELVRCFWENKHKGLRECIEAQRVLLEELDSKSNDQSSDPENEKLQLSIPQPQQSSSSKAVPLKRKSRNRARRSKLPVKGPVDSDLASSSSDSSDSSEAEFNQHNPLPEAITSTLERFCGAAKTADFGECLMFDMSYEPEDPECRAKIDSIKPKALAHLSSSFKLDCQPSTSKSEHDPKLKVRLSLKSKSPESGVKASERNRYRRPKRKRSDSSFKKSVNGSDSDVDNPIFKRLKGKVTDCNDSLRKKCLRKVKIRSVTSQVLNS